jgi:ABC-type bacteriocin/lantibiotic exporter with double-glycine peptidase domain
VAASLIAACAAGLVMLAGRPELLRRTVSTVTGVERLDAAGVVYQRTETDCGLAALAMALSGWNRSVPYGTLRQEVPVGPKGTSMLSLKIAAERHGLRATGWVLTSDDVRRLRMPAIAVVDGDHFVVLEQAGPDGVVVLDPARGRYRMSWAAFARRWQGVTLGFEPNPGPAS